MTLEAMTLADAQAARAWRNDRPDAMRTPYPLSQADQQAWYLDHDGRFFSIVEDDLLAGYGGIQHVQWESRIGELSLLMDPAVDHHRAEALDLILTYAFDTMRLDTVFAEVYECNRDLSWWQHVACGPECTTARLPNRKWYQGRYWGSLYISFDRRSYENPHHVRWRKGTAT